MPFALSRLPLEPRRRRIAVRTVEDPGVAPNYRRVVFEGTELAGFDSPGADDHIRIFLPRAGETLPADVDAAALASREFTPAAYGPDTLTIDFVLHGTGPASEWAGAARPGDEILVGGPRGSMVIDGDPDWWLLAGDLTALPAMRRLLALAPESVPVEAIVLAEDANADPGFGERADLRSHVVHSLDELLARLRAAQLPEGEGFAFVAAEQAVVGPAREILTHKGVDLAKASVKGYWRRGLSADAPK